jgi:hypothetical protein
MRLVLSIACSLMMCGAVSASTYDGDDGMEIVSAFQRLDMGGSGSAFQPFVKGKVKAVVNTAFASIAAEMESPTVVVSTTGLSWASDSADHTSTSGSATSVALYFQDNTNPFDAQGSFTSKLTGSDDKQVQFQASFDGGGVFSMGSTDEKRTGRKGKLRKGKFSRL